MAKKKVTKSKKPSFEQSLEQLEAIVAKLEGGQLALDDSLEAYELGVKHLKSCYQQLTAVERRIELVSQVDADGNVQTDDFDDQSSAALDEQGTARNRRRSAPKSSAPKSSAPKSSAPKSKRTASSEVDDASSLF